MQKQHVKEELPLPKGFEENKKFWGYDIHEKIGSGGFGRVFRATKYPYIEHDSSTNFAMKVMCLKLNQHGSARLNMLFQQEISIMKMLDNPHILKLEDCFELIEDDHKFYFIISELCDCDLSKMIKNSGPPSEARLIWLMSQLVIGFMELSKKGILHRDIKLSNIFWIRSQDKLIIGDFGVSKTADWTRSIVGSHYYRAPEIADVKTNSGRPGASIELQYDNKVDVYSLGVVFHALLTGELSTRYQDGYESTSLIENRPGNDYEWLDFKGKKLDKLTSRDPRIADLIRSMLQENPLERISMNELAEHKLFQANLDASQKSFLEIKTPTELLRTFVQQESVYFHIHQKDHGKGFLEQLKSHRENQQKKIERRDPQEVRQYYNSATKRYYEFAKLFIRARAITKKRDLGSKLEPSKLKVSGEPVKVQPDIEQVFLAVAYYFAGVFPEIEKTANKYLADRAGGMTPEKIVTNSYAKEAKHLLEQIKGDFPDKMHEALRLKTPQMLHEFVNLKIVEIEDKILSSTSSDRDVISLHHFFEQTLGSASFLVSFLDDFISDEAVGNPGWEQSIEELRHIKDFKVSLAYIRSKKYDLQKRMSTF